MTPRGITPCNWPAWCIAGVIELVQ